MPDDTKDREREQERRYVVIRNEEPGITSQTSDLLFQAEILGRKEYLINGLTSVHTLVLQ